ncbi:hypothetical protein FRB91_006045 [Serendipita sp. 411]|nr:hypothetical protein FRB91_006045 [Serendipita sp. 411]
MTLAAVKSSRSFRQFRVAVFAISVFLRLGYAFVLALEAFSLTTLVNKTHQIITISMFSTNTAALVAVILVGGLEAFKSRLSQRTSRARFEIVWMSTFWVLETAGATIFTLKMSSFHCDVIYRITGDATGVIFASPEPLSSQRSTTSQEANMCRLFNKMVFIGSWVTVGLSFAYLAYFWLLCMTAARRNHLVWQTPINKFDWSITAEPASPRSPDMVNPSMIQRPQNPHLSKGFNDSTTYLPPVFINPFEAKKDSFDSTNVPAEPLGPQYTFEPLGRHQVMAMYQPQPYLAYPQPVALAEERFRFSGLSQAPTERYSALGLEGMDQPAPNYRKSKPSLSIYVPPQTVQKIVPIVAGDDDYASIGRTMSAIGTSPASMELAKTPSEEPCAAIGKHMSMPFASPVSSEESAESKPTSSLKGLAPHSRATSVSHHTLYTKSQVDTLATNGHGSIQNVKAANPYPTIQQTSQRQSTLVKQDSLTARRSMRYGPTGPILPTHTAAPTFTGSDAYGSMYSPSHVRSQSDTSAFQPNPRLAPSSTWPPHTRQRIPSNSVYGNAAFSLKVSPSPAPSPSYLIHGNLTPSHTFGHESSTFRGPAMYSRPSSVSSSQSNAHQMGRPIPALLNALSPVIRHSGNFQGVFPAQHTNAAASHPFLDDNPFGHARSASHTPRSMTFEETAKQYREDKRRTSRLRKTPRNI